MSSLEDIINTFNEMGIVKKIIVGCCAVYLILMIIALLGHALLGIPLDLYTEETPTDYKDFAFLDTNGDGGLSFDEVKHYDHNSEFHISESDLYNIFQRCDKNGNGLLIGSEYDNYVISVRNYVDDLKKQKEQSQKEAQDKSKSSSSSSSRSSSSHSSSYSGDGEETCPYCGSEAIYESGGVYHCGECGATISNPDDLLLNYEEGYLDLLLPSFYYSISLV